jgi:molybdenum cofactor biosynthesis protein B
MSDAVLQHRQDAPASLQVVVVTLSDTRTLATDTSGQRIVEHLVGMGHAIAERVIQPDDPERLTALLQALRNRPDLDAVLLTGGTGISARDQTYETLSAMFTRVIPGFGELFRMLSFSEIGAAAMLSRAVGGLVGHLVVLAMPGSRAAVDLAMTRLVLPELPHLVREARRLT